MTQTKAKPGSQSGQAVFGGKPKGSYGKNGYGLPTEANKRQRAYYENLQEKNKLKNKPETDPPPPPTPPQTMKFITIFLLLALATPCQAVNLEAIKMIESGGNPMAYNKSEDGRGLFQINPICLKEYNEKTKSFVKKESLFIGKVNTRIARWYIEKRIPQMLRHYGKEVNDTNIIWAYNAGIGNVVKGIMPKTTRDYINKYNKLTEG